MTTESKEVISPEGVEERLISDQVYRLTLTGGGKYRVYVNHGKRPHSLGVFNTQEEAEKMLCEAMIIFAMMKLDPKAAMKILLGDMP